MFVIILTITFFGIPIGRRNLAFLAIFVHFKPKWAKIIKLTPVNYLNMTFTKTARYSKEGYIYFAYKFWPRFIFSRFFFKIDFRIFLNFFFGKIFWQNDFWQKFTPVNFLVMTFMKTTKSMKKGCKNFVYTFWPRFMFSRFFQNWFSVFSKYLQKYVALLSDYDLYLFSRWLRSFWTTTFFCRPSRSQNVVFGQNRAKNCFFANNSKSKQVIAYC